MSSDSSTPDAPATSAVRPAAAAPRKQQKSQRKTEPIELINTGNTPVTYDSEGRVIGGGQRIECAEPDKVALAAISRGYLRAQRGEQWLVVRDGELVAESDPDEQGSGASNTGDQRAEG